MEGSIRTRQKRRIRDCGVMRTYGLGVCSNEGYVHYASTGLLMCILRACTDGCYIYLGIFSESQSLVALINSCLISVSLVTPSRSLAVGAISMTFKRFTTVAGSQSLFSQSLGIGTLPAHILPTDLKSKTQLSSDSPSRVH